MNSFTIPFILILSSAIAASIVSAQPNNQREYLEPHNVARRAVGVRGLVWNETLARFARNYAQGRLGDCQLIHSSGPYGENLAAGSGEFTARQAVRLWVNERSDYSYGSNRCRAGRVCGHYTQVVWRNSRSVGCARLRCRNRWWFVICNYFPAGNIIGQRPY